MPRTHAPTLVFDLDGTLVDTVPDLAAALNRLMGARGLAPFTHPETALMVGDGARALVDRACAARGVVADEAAHTAFLADYTENAAVLTRPFPGIVELLETLRGAGWGMTICTNKPEAPTRALLGALGLAGYFPAIGAGDSFPVKKPDPRHLLSTLHAAGARPADSVMLGDHANDVAAAAGAGLPCIFALWGYGPPAMATGAAALAREAAEIPALAASLLGGARGQVGGG